MLCCNVNACHGPSRSSVNGGFEVHEDGGEKCTLWRGVTTLGGRDLLPVPAAGGGAT
jgi:hypothetical protein